jgi:hypothetical protein
MSRTPADAGPNAVSNMLGAAAVLTVVFAPLTMYLYCRK